MTKNLNSALKIKGGGREGDTCEVLQPCHPHPPKKFGTCTISWHKLHLRFGPVKEFWLFSTTVPGWGGGGGGDFENF